MGIGHGRLLEVNTGKASVAGPWFRSRILRRLMRNPLSVAGGVVILGLLFMMLFAPLISRYDPLLPDVPNRFQRPSLDHWFGTDELGRDIFSRVVWGARLSVLSGVVAVGIGLVGGVVIGLVSGVNDRIGGGLMRMMDVLLSFPGILIAIAVVATLGPGLVNAMIAVGVQAIPSFARLTRAQVLSVREMDYVVAARSVGATETRIVLKHILPNVAPPLIVFTTMNIGSAILSASVLSFLGLGVPPTVPEWGAMVSTGRQYFLQYPHVVLFPTMAIFITVLSFNFLGDGLRDALDPRIGNS